MAFPTGTCTTCQAINLDTLLATDRKTRRSDRLFLSYRQGLNPGLICPVCTLVLSCLPREYQIDSRLHLMLQFDDLISNGDIYHDRNVREIQMSTHGEQVGGGILRIYADEGTEVAQYVKNKRTPLSNLDERSLDRMQQWIVECDIMHQSCGSRLLGGSVEPESTLPTRVVDVSSNSGNPRIFVSNGQGGRYLALSHCWGGKTQVMLTQSTLARFQVSVTLSSLSRTFQDAIGVARLLGVRYLWIDSLCIVQDDKEDWLKESVKMGSVYENAYITLAATSAGDGNGGLQGFRPESTWVRFPCDATDLTRGYMWLTNASWSAETDLDLSPLNSRGWVSQERFLSRRIIHFAASQLYWECQDKFLPEEGPDLHFNGRSIDRAQFRRAISSFGYLGLAPKRRQQRPYTDGGQLPLLDSFHNCWIASVEHYCARIFSRPGDRLIALLGMASMIQKRTGLRFVDGHWDDGSGSFIRGLLWMPSGDQRVLPNDEHEQQGTRRCSSWSWAALDGPIIYDEIREVRWDQLPYPQLRLLKIEDNPRGFDWPTRPLHVSGVIRQLRKRSVAPDMYPQMKRYTVSSEDSTNVIGWVGFDTSEDEPTQLYFCPLGLHSYRPVGIMCLVLARVISSAAEGLPEPFRRVGIGKIENRQVAFGAADVDYKRILESCQRSEFWIV